MTTKTKEHTDQTGHKDGRVGIIDIGSNSIRLVIYDELKRTPVPIYNEKVLCALGKGLANTGVLNPEGVELARHALRRFLTLGQNMDITALHVFATAAVRDAKDGKAFTEYLEKTYDIAVEIVDGPREAKLGAYGVCASMYKPNGITADLGGGSLELVKIDEGTICDNASLLLGVLRIIDESKGDLDVMRALVQERFNELEWLANQRTKNFYAIGGTFRALAKMHICAKNYPFSMLHNYHVSAKPFASFLKSIIKMPPEKLEKQPGISRSRMSLIPGAALILEHLIRSTKASTIIFSASGIREGYLFDKLTPERRQTDGMIAACTEFALKGGRSAAYANELYTWMFPLISDETDEDRRLRLAFCLLSEVAVNIHPEFRAEWAYHRILYSAITGLNHRERVKLALALYHRYQFKLKHEWPSLTLLKKGDFEWAQLVGTAANLGYHLTGSISGSLHKSSFIIDDTRVSLHLSGAMQDIMGDSIKRRIEGVRSAYNDYVIQIN